MASRLQDVLCYGLLFVAGSTTIPAVIAQPDPATEQGNAGETSPLANEPKTTAELFQAANTLTDLARFDLARRYLNELLASDPNETELLELRNRFGTGQFLRLARVKDLQPESTQLLRRLEAVVVVRGVDTQYVATLIDRLNGEGIDAQLALTELKTLGAAAIPPVLQLAGQDRLAGSQARLVELFSRIDATAIDPLLGGLQSPSATVRLLSIDIVGRLRNPKAILWLWAPAFGTTRDQAEREAAKTALASLVEAARKPILNLTDVRAADELSRATLAAFRGELPWSRNENGDREWWEWDREAGKPVLRSLPEQDARSITAQRLARDWLEIAPEDAAAQSTYLLTQLSQPAQGETPASLREKLVEQGPAPMLRVLQLSLELQSWDAALVALDILSRNGSGTLLKHESGLKQPVIAALSAPEARVQFAAAETILKWDPRTPHRGTGRVVEILSRALRSTGQPIALVIDPVVDRGGQTAANFAALGYNTHTERSGQAGFLYAVEHGGISLIAIHANVSRWDLSQTVANFRADGRTGLTPLLLYGPKEMRIPIESRLAPLLRLWTPAEGVGVISIEPRVSRTARLYPPAAFIEETTNTADFESSAGPFLKAIATAQPTQEVLQSERRRALEWLSWMSEGQRSRLYDLTPAKLPLEGLTTDDNLGGSAIAALSAIPRPDVQEHLLNQLQAVDVLPELRSAAAEGLTRHVQRHGRLVREGQLQQLAPLLAAESDENLRDLLRTLVGALAKEDRGLGRRLLEFDSK